jgi:predicted CXXCH cytochrome family protein
MSCHRAHGNDPNRRLWAVTPVPAPATADGVCMSCHPNQAWANPDAVAANVSPTTQPVIAASSAAPPGGQTEGELLLQEISGDGQSAVHGATTQPAAVIFSRGAMLHPQTMPSYDVSRISTAGLPLVPGAAPGSSAIGCKTCHNPHAARTARSLLRSPDSATPAAVCFQCHDAAKSVEHSMHARAIMPQAQGSKLLCGPCHAVHAVDGSSRSKLWASHTDTSVSDSTEQRCLGCHDGKSAKRPFITVHPTAAMGLAKLAAAVSASASQPTTEPTTAPTTTAPVPLPKEHITCETCHLPHGKPGLPEPSAGTTKSMLAASKPMLRSDVDRNVCATCHGADASRVFLYFHEPERRKHVKPVAPVQLPQ